MGLADAGDSNSHWDRMFFTADGGKTWNPTPTIPVKPVAVRFVTPMDGWLVGDPSPPSAPSSAASKPGGSGVFGRRRMGARSPMELSGSGRNQAGTELYVTRDGARSWQKVSLAPPKEVYSGDDPSDLPPTAIYELPTFRDREHGLLPVTYKAISGTRLDGSAVLFATGDGGRTWKPDRILVSEPNVMINCGNPSTACSVSSVVADSTWMVVNHSYNAPPSFITLGAGARVDSGNVANGVFWPLMDRSGLLLDFVTPTLGWISWDGKLLSTTDGGVTWTPITLKLNQAH